MDSVLDLGCSTGYLISALKRDDPELKTMGVEVFQYQKDAAPDDVRFGIQIHDLRDPLPDSLRSDLVICTDVGEHIDPASLESFLNNLRNLCRKRLILTWSSTHPPVGAPPQHVCSMNPRTVRRLMRSFGFTLNVPATRKMQRELKARPDVYSWWLESLSVWQPNERHPRA